MILERRVARTLYSPDTQQVSSRERMLFGERLISFSHNFRRPNSGQISSEIFTVNKGHIGPEHAAKIGDTMLSILDSEGQRVGVITGNWHDENGKQSLFALQAHNGQSEYKKDIPAWDVNTWGDYAVKYNARDVFNNIIKRDVPGIIGHAIVELVDALDLYYDSSYFLTGTGDSQERRGRGMYMRIGRDFGDRVYVDQFTNDEYDATKFIITKKGTVHQAA